MLSPLAIVLALSTAAPVALPAELEREARNLETAIVAPCCWSQQVSVHQSPAADQVRQDIRKRLARGETRQQILDDYVVQFGERILVEPPARGYKLMLYVFPPVALVVSAAGIVAIVRRATARRRTTTSGETAAAPPPSDAYRDRLDDELRDLD
jgi:cytochrome c-type biogenesis protein CcmH